MKIAICYPPLYGPGVPLLSQNRQFQWYRSPVTSYVIYPVVPAYAATALKKNGYDVYWLDYVAERKSYQELVDTIRREQIDLIAMETKTPVVKQHWRIINDLKRQFSGRLTCVLMGDHVTAFPEESLRRSKVDYVVTGGDFDIRLLNLANYLSGK
ncbi:MAG TPA: cobalamin B12-binding domain-containing protein, partial [Patescibacteria group bacterium]|nr:cobalamin B12-binding domain-containing protein [Patescibacteria group bacterium]